MKYCIKRKEKIGEPDIKAYCEIIDEYIACVNCVFLKLIENDAQVLAQVTGASDEPPNPCLESRGMTKIDPCYLIFFFL